MNLKQLIRDYFTFSRNERKGLIILIFIIFVLAVANKLVFYFEKPAVIDKALLDSARQKLGEYNDSLYETEPAKVLFYFNPNLIDSLALDSLNVPDQVKLNLLRYRSKGGYFKSGEDLHKIYGMTEDVYSGILPYVLFDDQKPDSRRTQSSVELFAFNPNSATDKEFEMLGFSEKQIAVIRKYLSKSGNFKTKDDFLRLRIIDEDQKSKISDWINLPEATTEIQKVILERKKTVPIELNSADTTLLKQLPGIGSVLAKRIVKYRDLLGGFCSIAQLNEVYGMSEQTVNLIKSRVEVNALLINKLDLNFGDKSEFSKHPYLKNTLAVKIIKFRSRYGKINNLEVLRDSMILNIDEYTRIKPYF